MSFILERARALDKQAQVILFSSTAIALYGYDQGMMSLINTNEDYLRRIGIGPKDVMVGIIVAIYYLGCSVGAVLFSWCSDRYGRKVGIFFCLATASLGNLIMSVAGLGYTKGALAVICLGRVIMGLGVGGVDCVIPVYSAEISKVEARGKALAQEFQMNIFGLNMAFAINLGVTIALGKNNQWAWRIPIIVMQAYPFLLFLFINQLPESPRWLLYQDRVEEAIQVMDDIHGKEESEQRTKELLDLHEEEKKKNLGYINMLTPGNAQFHPTIVSIMGQINQALTGYGAVSVYGPQIFELLGFSVRTAEYLTQANYISYFLLMTVAWLLIDAVGRRKLLVDGSIILTICFLLLALFSGMTVSADELNIPSIFPATLGIISLFIATGAFGIGWLATVWLIPTEIFPTTARAQASAISVIIWGLANFAITLLSPILFNNLYYWIFLIFAVTNAVAGLWTYIYLPETGGRSFEENQKFFEDAKAEGTWRVAHVGAMYKRLPYGGSLEESETTSLLTRVGDQLS